jgi:hypothetical protein
MVTRALSQYRIEKHQKLSPRRRKEREEKQEFILFVRPSPLCVLGAFAVNFFSREFFTRAKSKESKEKELIKRLQENECIDRERDRESLKK